MYLAGVCGVGAQPRCSGAQRALPGEEQGLLPLSPALVMSLGIRHHTNTFTSSLSTLPASVCVPWVTSPPASSAQSSFVCLFLFFFEMGFSQGNKNIPKVPLAPCGCSHVPISVTLAGGSWLGLVLAVCLCPSLPLVGRWGSDPSHPCSLHHTVQTGGVRLLLHLLGVMGAPLHSTPVMLLRSRLTP